MKSDTPISVTRNAVNFFSGTAVSRLTGLLRDMAMAFYFGTSPALASFLLAYRFVYLFRRLFGEGILHQGFIPHFEMLKNRELKQSALFFRDLFWSMTLLLFGIMMLVEGGLFFLSGEISQLAQLLLPGIFFICLFGLTSGLLQSEKSFFLPSVSSAVYNLIWMVGIVALHTLPIQSAILRLSFVLSFAFFVQLFMTFPKSWQFLRQQLSIRECFRPDFFSPQLKQLLGPLFLGIAGVAAVQVNSAVDGIFARLISSEGPAYLWYSIRMQQLPLALFGIAFANALLPSLSRAAAEGEERRFQNLVEFAKRKIFALIFPCTMGIFVLGGVSVNLLFGRGDFGPEATMQTTYCLWAYGIGLLPTAFVQILAPAYYAKKDYRTPTIAFCSTALLNFSLNALLVFYFKLGVVSVALSTSVAAIFNVVFLLGRLRVEKNTLRSMQKVGMATLVSGLMTYIFDQFVFHHILPREFTAQIGQFATLLFLYFGLLYILCRALKANDLLGVYSSSK